jgi:hypothetical protein
MEEHVKAVGSFATSSASGIALQLPLSISLSVGIAHWMAPKLKLLIPSNKGQINGIDQQSLPGGDRNVYATLSLSYHASVANVALSDCLSNRLKMFYYEFLQMFIQITYIGHWERPQFVHIFYLPCYL